MFINNSRTSRRASESAVIKNTSPLTRATDASERLWVIVKQEKTGPVQMFSHMIVRWKMIFNAFWYFQCLYEIVRARERRRDWKKVPGSQRGKKKRTSKTCGAVRAQRKNNLRYTQIHFGARTHAPTHQIVVKATALFLIRFIFPLGKLTDPF